MRNRTVRRLCALVVFLSLPPASAAVGQTQQRTQRLLRMTNDVLSFELVPSFKGQYKGAMFETNRWGMRDLDYELKPPTGTYRIALVGSSFTMGAGVPLEKTHEWLIEDRLNREGPSLPGRRYEILNFSVGNYGVLQEVAVLTRKVFPFAPNAVLLAIHDVEQARMLNHVVNLVRNNVAIEFPYVRQKLQAAGVQNGMEIPELRRRIAPIAPDLVRWSYQRIAEICRENNVPLVGIVYPEPPREGAEETLGTASAWASAAGIPLLDLKGVFEGRPLTSVQLNGGRDAHLNALGHQLVANRLYQLLRDNDARALKLGFPS